MEKRIKFLFILTVIATIAVITTQCYWVFNQYIYSLQQLENELYIKTIKTAEEDRKLRGELQNKKLYTITRTSMGIKQNNDSILKTTWNFDIYIINNTDETTDEPITIRYDSLYIDHLYKSGKDIKNHQYEIESSDRKQDVYDALDRFLINEKCPFTIERLDSLLQLNELFSTSIKIETTDSTVWNPERINHTSFLNPVFEVAYPFDILQKQQFRILYSLKTSTVFNKMLISFICSVILSFLLIFCLIYQIRTIFRQQRIDELRKSFIYSMTHELKRPITALKLCISFFKNDKLMKDSKMKEDIIRNSHNELDNLSSYFSKLRDVMEDDLQSIPLNLSSFKLKELIEHCIEKQAFPYNRDINVKIDFENDDFEIFADKIHVANIFCNLLENAIKYSDGNTIVNINCYFSNEKYLIEVSDNGFGISEKDCKYVFNRFFRSANIIKTNIPGIGLGLYYVRLLLKAHNGNISLQSTLGKGSKFTIEIPKKQ